MERSTDGGMLYDLKEIGWSDASQEIYSIPGSNGLASEESFVVRDARIQKKPEIVVSNGGLIQLELASIERAKAMSSCTHVTDRNHRSMRACCWYWCFA